MTQPLRVLYLEDSGFDVKLTCRQLEHAGFALRADVVVSREEFTDALRSKQYDIVLSDYHLPGWSGLLALETVRSAGSDLPFILVTGTLGEETAVECIKKGATDYVLKDRLARLPVAVQHALEGKASRKMEDLYNHAPCGYHSLDHAGGYVRINDTELSWLGYGREEVLGKAFIDFLTPGSGKLFEAAHSSLKQLGSTPDLELEMVRKNGTVLPALVSITAVPDAGGHFSSCRCSVFDITRRKQAEAVLNHFFTLSLDLLCIAGFDGHFKHLNPAWEATLGFSREELMALPFIEFVHPDDREATLAEADRIMAGGVCVSFENRYLAKDGTYRWMHWNCTPLVERKEMYAVARDITSRKQVEDALMQAKEQAESASRLKDRFLSMMSHELRTPLNAILGFSELLPDERYGPLNDRQRRYVGNIHQAGKHLLRIINDILDLSKIEAGRLEVILEPVVVADIFREVVDSLGPLAKKTSQTLSDAAAADAVVRADPTRLKQVLFNLTGNAIKFTPAGGHIELTARTGSGHVYIAVCDNGPEIPAKERARIFEAFYRLSQSASSEGSGLGLAISSKLIELQGGRLELTSESGQGNCFHFSLPMANWVSRASSPAFLEPRNGPTRVLVIEDDRVAAHLIQSLLSSAGYEVISCDRPESAVAMTQELQPDAITLDVKMQPVGGWEILAKLKGGPQTRHIPVIMVTVLDQNLVAAILGADEYLVKPVDKAALLSTIERCLAARGIGPSLRPILVVEDDTGAREFISESLTTKGYRVAAVADGAAARDWVAASLPGLVILDLQLPQISGFELLSQWRSNQRTADLPVFVLTGKDLTPDEVKFLHSHAESLFLKGQDWRGALLRQLERILTPHDAREQPVA